MFTLNAGGFLRVSLFAEKIAGYPERIPPSVLVFLGSFVEIIQAG